MDRDTRIARDGLACNHEAERDQFVGDFIASTGLEDTPNVRDSVLELYNLGV
jgi:hypothetical protein